MSLNDARDLLLGLVLDKPVGPSVSGLASPSQSVCGIKDTLTVKLRLRCSRLKSLPSVRTSTKLKELVVIWNAPSYRLAFTALVLVLGRPT